jgi:hypothetical protein
MLHIGQRVRHRETGEVGIVVHTWVDARGDIDAYVALFGEAVPEGAPTEKPYVLRYFESSLEVLSEQSYPRRSA